MGLIGKERAKIEAGRRGQKGWRSGFRFIFGHCCSIVVVPHTPDIQPLSLFVPSPFSSTKAAGPSPGIAKEQPRGRIYCSYCNVDESPAEFRELAVYFRPSPFHTRPCGRMCVCMYIGVGVRAVRVRRRKVLCFLLSRDKETRIYRFPSDEYL